jgi:hypothetical protein
VQDEEEGKGYEAMIDQHGYLKPSGLFLKTVRNYADDSFTSTITDDITEFLPKIDRWVPVIRTNVCLRMKCVPAHMDDAMPDFPSRNSPRRNLLWLMGGGPVHLHVANDQKVLIPGEWVLFDDNLMHSVIAYKTWFGLAVQGKYLPSKRQTHEMPKMSEGRKDTGSGKQTGTRVYMEEKTL